MLPVAVLAKLTYRNSELKFIMANSKIKTCQYLGSGFIVEQNGVKFGTGVPMQPLEPFSVQGHFGIIRCTCLKLPENGWP